MTAILSQAEGHRLGLAKRPNKYGAKRAREDGYGFDSGAELGRYRVLKLRKMAGEIGPIEVHPQFDIIMNGKRCGVYEADFRYLDLVTGETHVEDYKGAVTALFRLKKALVEAQYGITVEIVRA